MKYSKTGLVFTTNHILLLSFLYGHAKQPTWILRVNFTESQALQNAELAFRPLGWWSIQWCGIYQGA